MNHSFSTQSCCRDLPCPFFFVAIWGVILVLVLACARSYSSVPEFVIFPEPKMDGYAVDSDADGAGDRKILGHKFHVLSVGAIDKGGEARAWIPFRLSPEQKNAVARMESSVTLRLFLADKRGKGGGIVEICGAGDRKETRVNQNDYASLCKKLVPNAFGKESPIGINHEFDVTDFVREEALRPDSEDMGFGFLIRLHDGDSSRNIVPNTFFIGSSINADEGQRPSLLVSGKARTKNLPDPKPDDPAALRVLMIGNSILKNSPLRSKGWAGNWGMAASKEEADFAHLLMARIRENLKNRPVVFKLHNMASWERNWQTVRNDAPIIAYAKDFNPDLIVVCLSENTKLRDEQIDAYAEKYESMLSEIGARQNVDVIVRTSFWKINANTDIAISKVAERRGWPCVKCSDLSDFDENMATHVPYALGPEPVDPGVRAHPSDKGMQAIANRIWEGGLSTLVLRASEWRPPEP